LADLPPPKDSIEALIQRVGETHLQARRNYVLDSRLEENLFRGELTYFHCLGNPIVAGDDRRRLWQEFAPHGFRLLPMPGGHAEVYQEPQSSVFRNLLRACHSDVPPAGIDCRTLFDRTYRIDIRGRESIVSSTGEIFRLEHHRMQGQVDCFEVDDGIIRFAGWAVEPCKRLPAQTIAVFLEHEFLGYGASFSSRSDVAKSLSAPSAQYSGFDFRFRRGGSVPAIGRPRLFVLSDDGSAAELRIKAEQELIVRLQLQLAAMEHSTSWRITWPLRQIRHIAAKVLGR
jgi:hypothetical protein